MVFSLQDVSSEFHFELYLSKDLLMFSDAEATIQTMCNAAFKCS